MKTIKLTLFILLALHLQAMAAQSLKKSDPEVIALCDKNGDGKITNKEYVCYLHLKSRKLDEENRKLDEESRKLIEKIKENLSGK